MADASTSLALTEQHRQAQLNLRDGALRDFLLLWPLWNGDSESFGSLVQATMPLVTVYRKLSATLASSYYSAFRSSEEVAGGFTPAVADAINPQQITRSMYATGHAGARTAMNAGRSPQDARQTALTRVSGAVSRHVLDGGRDTILQAVNADEHALGFARITDGDPCYFCLTLASRGAVYKTEQAADFQAHDWCGCSAMAVFDGTQLPASTQRYRDTYNAAQRAAVDDGMLQHGENTSAARLNAVRRYLAASTH